MVKNEYIGILTVEVALKMFWVKEAEKKELGQGGNHL